MRQTRPRVLVVDDEVSFARLVGEVLQDKGYEVIGSGPDEFASFLKKDRESRGRAVKISGAKAE